MQDTEDKNRAALPEQLRPILDLNRDGVRAVLRAALEAAWRHVPGNPQSQGLTTDELKEAVERAAGTVVASAMIALMQNGQPDLFGHFVEALDIAERAPHVREELVAALAGAKSED